MPRTSELPAPDALTGLELVPILQGAGLPGNRGLPLMAAGSVPRGAVLALRVSFVADMAATADADPGAGNVRWNDADPELATEIYIDDVGSDATDLSALWATLQVGGFLYLQAPAPDDRGNWQKWQITSVDDLSGYARLGVTLQSADGAFSDDDELELTLQQPNPTPGVDRNIVSALSGSGSVAIDCALGDYFTLALTGNATISAPSNVPPACSIMVRIAQDSTPRTLGWPASFKWAGGAPGAISTAAGAIDVLAMSTFDNGATWQVTLGKGFA